MSSEKLLFLANTSLFVCFGSLIASGVMAYGYESYFPISVLVPLHISQIMLAGFIKLSYVVRLIAQQQLGIVEG